jgi:hypothetical protein
MRTCLLAALLLASPVAAQEKITLTEPAHVDPGAAEFRLITLNMDAAQAHIVATLGEVIPGSFGFKPNGKILTCEYFGDDAESLLTQLNTMNFTTVSLQKRVIQVCQKDKKIPPGTMSGTPSTFTPMRTTVPTIPMPGTRPTIPPPGIGRGGRGGGR